MMNMGQRGSAIVKINYLLSALLILAAVTWPQIQGLVHKFIYQKDINALFEHIADKQWVYYNKNSRFVPFGFTKNSGQLKELKLNLDKSNSYDFSVIVIDDAELIFRIIAQLKRKIMQKWWFLHGPKAKLNIIYEARLGEKGRIVPK